MAKYEIRPGLNLTTIPGVGVVQPGDILDGDYERFVPGKLQRVRLTGTPTRPAPAPVPKPVPVLSLVEPLEDEEEDLPNMGWLKSELIDYAAQLGLDTSGNKQTLVDRISEALDKEA